MLKLLSGVPTGAPGAATFQPGRPNRGAVAGQHRDLESSVPIEERRIRAVQLHSFTADLEIRDFGPVFRGGLVLADLEALGFEKCGQALEFFPVKPANRPKLQA